MNENVHVKRNQKKSLTEIQNQTIAVNRMSLISSVRISEITEFNYSNTKHCRTKIRNQTNQLKNSKRFQKC